MMISEREKLLALSVDRLTSALIDAMTLLDQFARASATMIDEMSKHGLVSYEFAKSCAGSLRHADALLVLRDQLRAEADALTTDGERDDAATDGMSHS